MVASAYMKVSSVYVLRELSDTNPRLQDKKHRNTMPCSLGLPNQFVFYHYMQCAHTQQEFTLLVVNVSF